jgi:hypothetical protein
MVNNNPINFNDPTGNKPCDEDYGCSGPPPSPDNKPGKGKIPDFVDLDDLNKLGKDAYVLYLELWLSNHSQWWWADPTLGGDGEFTIADFVTMILTMEMGNGYSIPAQGQYNYKDLWEEALVRHAYQDWREGINGTGPSNAGILNFINNYSGGFRTSVEAFSSPVSGAIDIAKATTQAMLDPSVAGEWAKGFASDRPFDVGSHGGNAPASQQLFYIVEFIESGCNTMTFGLCYQNKDFTFILTGAEAAHWGGW